MKKETIKAYLSDIVYCSKLSVAANNPFYDKSLVEDLYDAIEFIFRNDGIEE